MESILFDPNSLYQHIREKIYRHLDFEDLVSVQRTTTGGVKCVKMFPNKFKYVLADGQLWRFHDEKARERPLILSFDQESGKCYYLGPKIQSLKTSLTFKDPTSMILDSDQALLHQKILAAVAPELINLYLELKIKQDEANHKESDEENDIESKIIKDFQPGPSHASGPVDDICSLLPECFPQCIYLSLDIDKKISYKFFHRILSLFLALIGIHLKNRSPSLHFLPDPKKLVYFYQEHHDILPNDKMDLTINDNDNVYDFSSLKTIKLSPDVNLAEDFDPNIVGLDWTSPQVKLPQLECLKIFYSQVNDDAAHKTLKWIAELLYSIATQCPKTFRALKFSGRCPNLGPDETFGREELFPVLLTQRFSSDSIPRRLALEVLKISLAEPQTFVALANLLVPGRLKYLKLRVDMRQLLDLDLFLDGIRQPEEIFKSLDMLYYRQGWDCNTDLMFMQQIVSLTRYTPRLTFLRAHAESICSCPIPPDSVIPCLTAITPSLAETLDYIEFYHVTRYADRLLEFCRGLKSLKTLNLSRRWDDQRNSGDPAAANIPAFNLWTYIEKIYSGRQEYGLDSLEKIYYIDSSAIYMGQDFADMTVKSMQEIVVEQFPPDLHDDEKFKGFEWTFHRKRSITFTFPPLL